MPYYLLINPLSGSYSPAIREQLLLQLEAAGIVPQVLTVTGPEDARLVSAQIEAAEQNPVVIVAGGDGTINAVVNALAPGRATLGILPVGTANVLARELGIDSIKSGISCIAEGKSRPLAVGLIERENGSSQRFLLMAGVGLDGNVVHGVRLREKRLLKKGAYLLSALRCLLKWPCDRFEIVADGRPLECHSVIVCNGARYGGDLELAPEADISVPVLDLFCITSTSRRSYLKIIVSALYGRIKDNQDVTLLRAVEVSVGGGSPIQVDGDSGGFGPVRVSAIGNFAKIFTA
ncbi:MAG: diacylglycerol kinase family lipid kinase [Geobacter sp.]|nr:diacylglycerol kinase family lipid kinase [Geobacter sp.]